MNIHPRHVWLRLLGTLTLGLGLALILLWLLSSSNIFIVHAKLVPTSSENVTREPSAQHLSTSPARRPSTDTQVKQAISTLPLRFIANAGQTDPSVRFIVKGAGHTIFFTPQEIVFSAMPQASKSKLTPSVVRLSFPGANPNPIVEGVMPLSGTANFFLGNDSTKWQTGVSTYGAVAYRDIYSGIDLIYLGTEGHLKSEFVVAPGVDPSIIQMTYEGIEEMHLDKHGRLILQTASGQLIEEAPLIYQELNGVRQKVAGSYKLLGESLVRFQIAEYDHTRPLVIDPELAYSSYLGGGAIDNGRGITVDSTGNIYLTGHTGSTDFPTQNPTYPSRRGNLDAFVTKIANTGGTYTYEYSTYLGGNDDDYGESIAVDDMGHIYVTGRTGSSNFPVTADAVQTSYGGGLYDIFVTEIISNGAAYTLSYSTYLGGSQTDWGDSIAVDSAGNAYVTGQSDSDNFPVTSDAIQASRAGGRDVFVTQFISVSASYVLGYSSYLGGQYDDWGYGIAVSDPAHIYVAGYAESDDFPTTSNAIQTSRRGSYDAFVTQIISASGIYTYGYSSYLGGSGPDYGYGGIAVDSEGNMYVAGETGSSNFPTTTNAVQAHLGGGVDAFVTQIISTSGVYTYGYSTFLGGSIWDTAWGIAVDSEGATYVTGPTRSSDFPTTTNAIQPTLAGNADTFVTQIISASGIYTYGYSSYLGGSGFDYGYGGIAVDNEQNAYVTGNTSSSNFPTTTNAIQSGYGGNYDAFVTKISDLGNPTAVGLTSFWVKAQSNTLIIHWETAIEVDNVGFNLYRSESPSGPYIKLNDTLIPSQAPGAVFGASYTWQDDTAQPGVIYYYKLEDVDTHGRLTLHGPISASTTPNALALRHVATRTTLNLIGGMLIMMLIPIVARLSLQRRQ